MVFSGKGSSESFASGSSTVDRKKKNFSFSRKFPFMKSKDQISGDETSDAEGKCPIVHSMLGLIAPSYPVVDESCLVLSCADSSGWYTPHYGIGTAAFVCFKLYSIASDFWYIILSVYSVCSDSIIL